MEWILSQRLGERDPLRFAMKCGNSFHLNTFRKSYDAAKQVSRHPSDQTDEASFFMPARRTEVNHGFAEGESFAE